MIGLTINELSEFSLLRTSVTTPQNKWNCCFFSPMKKIVRTVAYRIPAGVAIEMICCLRQSCRIKTPLPNSSFCANFKKSNTVKTITEGEEMYCSPPKIWLTISDALTTCRSCPEFNQLTKILQTGELKNNTKMCVYLQIFKVTKIRGLTPF